MKNTLLAAALSLTFLATPALAHRDPQPIMANAPRVQIAILLDTSNSMDGLIDQTKSQLWKIVNELSKAQLKGKAPRLEVALYEYGNNSLSVKNNWIRQVSPFTTDLDRISEDLFRLKTNGGEEYCGAVIRESVKNLAWSQRPSDLKAIFIAGNEPFTQGHVPYQESCAAARQKGIVVNTIFCGNRNEGIQTHWADGASVAAGQYLCIDQDRKAADVPSPYDDKISQLGRDLNKTYVAYGPAGGAAQQRQQAQDSASGAVSPSSMAERAQTKASANYNNANWDMVDAKKEGRLRGAMASPAALPPELKGKSQKDIEVYVDHKAQERSRIQKQIAELSGKRSQYLALHQQKGGADTLDQAVLKIIRKQAMSRGYTFKQ